MSTSTYNVLFLLFCLSTIWPSETNSERISELKCKEYEKATQKTYQISGLLGQDPITRIFSNCQHNSVPLIVGGTKAEKDEFPHQALLGYKKRMRQPTKWLCGGSLISSNFVLTAAHCMTKTEGLPKYVKLGMNTRSQWNDGKAQVFGVVETFQHPSYSIRTFKNDIGLLKLHQNVKFTKFLYPACLPINEPEETKAIVTGFGQTGQYESVTQDLMKAVLERFSHDECSNIYGYNRIDQNSMLCYGNRTHKGDACRGDSGGPIQVGNDNFAKCTYRQIGVISFGLANCGTPGYPGIYTNVYHYLDWIEGIVWGDELNKQTL